jgi:hypothetical protein
MRGTCLDKCASDPPVRSLSRARAHAPGRPAAPLAAWDAVYALRLFSASASAASCKIWIVCLPLSYCSAPGTSMDRREEARQVREARDALLKGTQARCRDEAALLLSWSYPSCR